MKKILLFNCFIVGLLIALFLGVGQAFAQAKTPEQIAAEKGITFPIAELGNCGDFNACRTFCEDPVNQNTCIDFAKKKGFHKEESNVNKDEIIKAAKNTLGCDSEESCRSYCSQEANHDKCIAFAQKHNLGGGQVHDPSKAEILQKAKTILGCDSPSSCRSFCEQEANREKCSEFAKQTGLRGGEQQVGPGGCTSEETCKAFCSDPVNFQVCSRFQSSVGRDTRDFKGPGGCTSEESCRAYCQSHPNECGYSGDRERNYDPIEMCSKTPNCSWQNNTCQCGSYGGEFGREAKDYADFCRQNPDKCGPGQSGGFDSSQKREEFEKFCRENPDKCQRYPTPSGYPAPSGSINPEDYCKQYPERCNFTPYPSPSAIPNYTPSPNFSPYPQPYSSPGSGGYDYSPYPYPTYQPASTYQPTSTSYPSSTSQPTYQEQSTYQQTTSEQYQQPTSTSYPGSVQGASTQKSLFQRILQTILGL